MLAAVETNNCVLQMVVLSTSRVLSSRARPTDPSSTGGRRHEAADEANRRRATDGARDNRIIVVNGNDKFVGNAQSGALPSETMRRASMARKARLITRRCVGAEKHYMHDDPASALPPLK